VCVSPHHPSAEKGVYTLDRAGKRTRQPERVISVAGGFGLLGCGAGCDDCSGGVRAVTVRLSGSAMT